MVPVSGLWSPLADACQDFADAYWDGADNRALLEHLSRLERAVGKTRMTVAALTEGPLPVRVMHCAHCGREYEWRPAQRSDPVTRYCRPMCRRENFRRRQFEAQYRARAGLPPCPTPEKVAHPTWEAADQAVATTHDPDGGLHAYECSCGAFHAGHRSRWYTPTEESHEQHA